MYTTFDYNFFTCLSFTTQNMESKDETLLKQLYFNSKHYTAFGGVSKLWKYAKSHGSNLTKQQVVDWLSKQDVYTLHHPAIH